MPQSNSQLITLCPDFYTRYLYVFQIIKNINKNNSCNILEVGGKGGILGDFIKNNKLPYKLTILDILPDDINEPTTCDLFLQKDFNEENIPQYDFIVSLDALEHIVDKNKFINTALEKCSTLIISAPFESKPVEEIEKSANQFYKNYTGIDHPWLKEHFQNKLPDTNWFENLIKQKKYYFNKIESNNVENWLLFMTTNFLPSFYNLKSNTKLKELNQFYNQNFSKLGDSQSPTYRSIYTISKNIKNLHKIKPSVQSIDTLLKTQLISLTTNFFAKEIYDLNNQINQVVFEYESEIKKINENIKKNEDLKNQINLENNKIYELEQSLKKIRSAKAFKLWRLYCKLTGK